MTPTVAREYRRFRKAGYRAEDALRAARVLDAWQDAEADGVVRLVLRPDDTDPMDIVDPGIWPEHSREKHKAEYLRLCDSLGIWGIIGEWCRPECGECGRNASWEQADSCWGFTGYRDPLSPLDNPYVIDIMAVTLEAAGVAS